MSSATPIFLKVNEGISSILKLWVAEDSFVYEVQIVAEDISGEGFMKVVVQSLDVII